MTAQTILPANTLSSGYDVANSLRFNDGDSAYMHKDQSAGDRNKATFSAWIKRSHLGSNQAFFGIHGASSDAGQIEIRFQGSGDSLHCTGHASNWRRTNRAFRDISAWYHIVVAFDTTQGTAGNRVKVYVNGVQETSFAAAEDPDENEDLAWGLNNAKVVIGSNYNADSPGDYFDGYMAEVVLIDGQQLDPTSFGEFDSDSPTIWKPKDVSGLTFGTNGFYLDFKDSSNLGNDANGGTDLTEVNLAATDQTTDTCTNNFATINPLDNYWAGATLSEGNTKVSTGSSNEAMSTSTFAMTQGKWYMEADFISGAGARMCGITPTPSFQTSSHGKAGDVTPHTATYIGSGKVQEGDGSGGQTELADYNSYATGDIIGIYMDLDNFKAYFSKNGTLQSATGIDLDSLASNGTGHYMFFVGDNNSGALVCEANFGNGFQSLSSAVADDNGYGAFEYSPNITGDSEAKKFYSCCTKNLAEFG